ncbi:hypothetical protein DPMN_042342 [Dreissena polymorpha]|uniref:Uncharacterized protein n=1 Tax=Dreissena polymorpha TaxID=45954 RepID=A0A9D4D0X0_DREPO|nr:hypothetical protein DPMN_042342 [Dreissena polymorpha]
MLTLPGNVQVTSTLSTIWSCEPKPSMQSIVKFNHIVSSLFGQSLSPAHPGLSHHVLKSV